MSGRGGAGWSFPVPGQDAKKAIQKWKTGTVHMSGTVAERLFKLLPPRMPLADKYQLFESLRLLSIINRVEGRMAVSSGRTKATLIYRLLFSTILIRRA